MLNFIGVGSAFTPNLGNTSAYFLKNNNLYLLDCGELVFKELYNLIEFDKIDNIYIFITHTHSDHVGSLGSLISYLKIEHDLVSQLYHGGVDIENYLNLVGVADSFYEASEIERITIDELSFEFVETKHSAMIPSYGLIIEKLVNKIYYSGDASNIPSKILNAFIEGEIDHIYQDVSFDEENTSHLSLNQLKDMVPENLRERVTLMHLEKDLKETPSDFGFKIARKA